MLRTFLCVAEERSFTRAAGRVGRTQSAVSMQMSKLEDILGERLFHRGRGERVELTEHGRYLLGRANDMLAINDQVWSRFQEPEISGEIRLGTPDDYALEFLPEILRRFSEAHPAVQISVLCADSEHLVEALNAGKLDLTLLSEGTEPPHGAATLLWRGRLAWVTSSTYDTHLRDPLPLAVASETCGWRRAAIRALEAADRRYRIVYSSASHIGTLVPVIAGLAVAVSVPTLMPAGIRLLAPGEAGLPPLPEYGIVLLRGASQNTRTLGVLEAAIVEEFRKQMER
ncbi:MAG: LysR substrate-binding domain-containing protein [Acidiphilium sp.]